MAASVPTTSTSHNTMATNSPSDDLPPQLDPAVSINRPKVRQADANKRLTRQSVAGANRTDNEVESIPKSTLSEITTQVHFQRESITQLSAAVTQLTAKLGNMRSHSRATHEIIQVEEDERVESDSDDELIDNLFDGLYDANKNVADADVDDPELQANIDELLNSTEDPPEYGAALPEEVATSFNRLPLKDVKPELLKKLKDQYQVPINAKLLGAPRINPEIWSRLNPTSRTKDGQLQYTQQLISRSLVAHARMAAAIRQSVLISPLSMPKELTKDLFSFIMDSATSLGAAQKDLNMKRRVELKPRLGDLGVLCSSRVPITEMLFGDNLELDIKTAKATSRLVQTGSTNYLKRSYPSRGSFQGSNFDRGNYQPKRPSYGQALNMGRGQTQFRPSSFRPQYSRSFQERRKAFKPPK